MNEVGQGQGTYAEIPARPPKSCTTLGESFTCPSRHPSGDTLITKARQGADDDLTVSSAGSAE